MNSEEPIQGFGRCDDRILLAASTMVCGHFLCPDISTRKRRPKLCSRVIETLLSRHCSLLEVCDKPGPAHFDPVISCDWTCRNAEYRMKPKTRWDAFTLLEWLKRTDKNSERFAQLHSESRLQKSPSHGIANECRTFDAPSNDARFLQKRFCG